MTAGQSSVMTEPAPGTAAVKLHDADVPRLTSAVFVQPHPDDVVLSVSALLCRAVEPLVVSVFSGVPHPSVRPSAADRLTGMTSPRERMMERRREDAEALALYGATAVHLDFVELAHRTKMSPDGVVLRDDDESGIVPAIEEALMPVLASRTTIVAPLGIGGNPNHVQVAGAVRRVAARLGGPVVWYADYPYAAWFGWPHWVRGEEADSFLQPDALWEGAFEAAGVCESEAVVVSLSSEMQAFKLGAFEKYRTQVSAVERGDLKAVSHPEHIRFEVMYGRFSGEAGVALGNHSVS